MSYLFSQYWIFIALALVLGLFVGWATCGDESERGGGWLAWAIVGFLGALFLAIFKVVPGFLGHLLEVALLLGAAYVIGCAIGCGGHWITEGEGVPSSADDAGNHATLASSAAASSATGVTHAEIFGKDTSASYPGARPAALAAPRGGKADDLTAISGVDAGTAKALGDIGVHHHDQIAAWDAPQKLWVEHHLAQAGRIDREDWVTQAKRLASGAEGAVAAVAASAIGGTTSTGAQGVRAANDAAVTADAASTSGVSSAAGSPHGAVEASQMQSAASGTPVAGMRDARVANDTAANDDAVATTGAPSKAAATPGGATMSGAQSPAASAIVAGTAAPSNAITDATAGAAAPRMMTDGARSLMAQQKKAEARGASPVASAPVAATEPAGAESHADAPPAAYVAPARAFDGPARAPMTDGARSLAVLKRKDEERAARRAAAASAPTAASDAPAPGDVDRPSADLRPDAPKDDLKLIKGVGPENEVLLNGLGVRRFAQIADWTPANARWVGHSIKFPGRIEREHWIDQARLLAAGVDTAHSAAVKSGALSIDARADAPLSDVEAKALGESLPQQAAAVDDEASYSGARPLGLAAARGGKPDDLKLIKGVGKQNEERLHALGVWHFEQVAAWTPDNVKWIGSYLSFPGRIDREEWIAQAAALARGEKTGFAKRVQSGDVPTSRLI